MKLFFLPADSTFEHGVVVNLEVTPQSLFSQLGITCAHWAEEKGRFRRLLCFDVVVAFLQLHLLNLLFIWKWAPLSPDRTQDGNGQVGIGNYGGEHWLAGLHNLASVLSMLLALLAVLNRRKGCIWPPKIGIWGRGWDIDIVGMSGLIQHGGKSIAHLTWQRPHEVLWMSSGPAIVFIGHLWKIFCNIFTWVM